MLRRVPVGMSPSGCFTVTRPDLQLCLNWWCEPLTRARYQPSDSSFLITCLLFMVVIVPTNEAEVISAAHALSLHAVLVTHNTREFSRVAGLQLDNWALEAE